MYPLNVDDESLLSFAGAQTKIRSRAGSLRIEFASKSVCMYPNDCAELMKTCLLSANARARTGYYAQL